MSRGSRHDQATATRVRPRSGKGRRSWPAALLIGACSGCVTAEIIPPASPRSVALPAPTIHPAARTMASTPSAVDPASSVRAALPPAIQETLLTKHASPPDAPAAAPGGRGDAKGDPAVEVTSTSPVDPTIPPINLPPVVPPATFEYPIDLTTSLRLAEFENPQIAEARQRIVEAEALRQGAYALLLPSFNAGTNYHGHTGNLQRSTGRILSLSEQSIYFGGGARTVAAESVAIPAVNIFSPLADALFEPLAASQNLERARFDASSTANTILMEVATAYFDLVQAEGSLELFRETETESNEVARLTGAYAVAGQGRKADANRAATTLKLIQREVERGEEEVGVASARLARRLHLDPSVRIRPMVARIAPIALVDLSTPTEDLVRVALERRPEMGARAALVGVAETRLRQEIARPFLPTVWLGFSGGGFAGGSNLVPPFIGNAKGRTDFDVRVFWTLQNLGLGNLAIQRRRRAEIGEAIGAQSRTINAVRREVASARGEALAAREQIEVTRRQLATSERGFREDLDRIRGTVGLPIELTNSLDLLSEARQNHLKAILNYNRAQVRLFVALGSPPPLDRPADAPLPPAPIAWPPLPLAPLAANSTPADPPLALPAPVADAPASASVNDAPAPMADGPKPDQARR